MTWLYRAALNLLGAVVLAVLSGRVDRPEGAWRGGRAYSPQEFFLPNLLMLFAWLCLGTAVFLFLRWLFSRGGFK